MKRKTTTQELILITAATVSGELGQVNEIAKGISLGVMNAKTISHRAGESAKGFQPITDFIEQIAREVSQFVVRISKEASILSGLAVMYNRREKTLKQFLKAKKNGSDVAHISTLIPVIEMLSDATHHDQKLLNKKLCTLIQLLDEMKHSSRSTKVISTISRVEASSAKEFRKNLEAVADDLESSIEEIRGHVTHSHHELTDVMEQLNREARL